DEVVRRVPARSLVGLPPGRYPTRARRHATPVLDRHALIGEGSAQGECSESATHGAKEKTPTRDRYAFAHGVYLESNKIIHRRLVSAVSHARSGGNLSKGASDRRTGSRKPPRESRPRMSLLTLMAEAPGAVESVADQDIRRSRRLTAGAHALLSTGPWTAP